MHYHRTQTFNLYFNGVDTVTQLIDVAFPVSKIIVKSINCYTAAGVMGASNNLIPIINVRSNLIDNRMLFHYSSQQVVVSATPGHEFLPTNKNIKGNYDFQLTYNNAPIGSLANINSYVTFTLEFVE